VLRGNYLNRQSKIANRKSTGGKGIRTPDFQLAKLALYQLSYAPCEVWILDCGLRIANLEAESLTSQSEISLASGVSAKADARMTI
jgi:hypothetical protein